MSSFKIFDIAGSGISAQSVRLNTVASNLANADSVSGDPATVYKARHPVFESVKASVAAQALNARPTGPTRAAPRYVFAASSKARPTRPSATSPATRSPTRTATSTRRTSTSSKR